MPHQPTERLLAIPNPAFRAWLAFEDPSNLLPERIHLSAGSNRAEVTSSALALYRDILVARPELAPIAAVVVYFNHGKYGENLTPILTIGPTDLDLQEA